MSITAVVVKYGIETPKALTNSDKSHVVLKKGLATTWFERIYEEKQSPRALEGAAGGLPRFHIPLTIRTSNFRLPKDLKAPVILVGPGTGVAPMR